MTNDLTPEERQTVAEAVERIGHKLVEVAGRIAAGEDCGPQSAMATEVGEMIDALPETIQ
jgi:bacterioferritin-associated ferredoxin